MTRPRGRLLEALLFSTCMIAFGLCAHRPALLIPRLAALTGAAGVLVRSLTRADHPVQQLGLTGPPMMRLVWLVPLIAAGVGLGALYRSKLGLSILPERLGWFALIAVSIGACEELAYRGFVQGWVRGPWRACAVAAAAHTGYKVALFSLPPAGIRADLLTLAAATFFVGFLFGLARKSLGAVVFPIAAHVAFDAVVYGDLLSFPWWVL